MQEKWVKLGFYFFLNTLFNYFSFKMYLYIIFKVKYFYKSNYISSQLQNPGSSLIQNLHLLVVKMHMLITYSVLLNWEIMNTNGLR